jgi:hypothetical protein
MDKQGNKTGGRVKGTPNAVTAEVRGMIAEIVKGNMNKVKEDLTKLTPKDRVDAIAKLLPYVVPRMVDANITETTLTPEEAAAAFMALTD